MKNLKAFTLIELLIVVAIIAILAAIAVPNFLEAQVRAKVSRAKADMRTLDTGNIAYHVDNNKFPQGNAFGLMGCRDSDPCSTDPTTGHGLVLENLSTPVAYLSNAFLVDPFETRFRSGSLSTATGEPTSPPSGFNINADPNPELAILYRYYAIGPNSTGTSNEILNHNPPGDFNDAGDESAKYYFALISAGPDNVGPAIGGLLSNSTTTDAISNNVYNATNGTISYGSIFRINGTDTRLNSFYETMVRIQN